ncbi:MAG: NAD-binding protein [Cyanobacteria bacterium REEB65]|nr:NAD-binding protein [Cyanobacteria bacterium REEB65]
MIVIFGCGQMGTHLARKLDGEGQEVTVIDPDRHNLEGLGEEFKGQMVMGLGIDRDVLTKARVHEASVFIAVARDVNTNIMAALVAKTQLNVPRVVARIEDPKLVDLYRRYGIETISPTADAAAKIEDMVLRS